MNSLNKEILRLALPSILANITVPIVGMVDTAVAGHMPSGSDIAAASFIGAISLGSMLFSLLYWNFSFLRSGTGGLTAQAVGRGDYHECACIFARGAVLSLLFALLLLVVQSPFLKLALAVTDGSGDVEMLSGRYFLIRIWAAPATLSLMVFRGWFVGLQDSISSMWTDLVVNCVNVAASVALTFGVGDWEGLGFDGIALGTVVAQYSGLAYCILASVLKYGRKILFSLRLSDLREVFRLSEMGQYMKMNTDLFIRSLGFTGIYIGYTMIAATLGDLLLACSSIMMQMLMLFSYFTDGFAYAGEALVGKFIGARDKGSLVRTVKYIFIWSFAISAVFICLYLSLSVPFIGIFTSDANVVGACSHFVLWLALMPLLGCAAFTFDGIYLGAVASAPIRDAMVLSALCFLSVWFVGRQFVTVVGYSGLHLLLTAYFVHLFVRTAWLTLHFKKWILGPTDAPLKN